MRIPSFHSIKLLLGLALCSGAGVLAQSPPVMVKDVSPYASASGPMGYTTANGRLFFLLGSDYSSRLIGVSDGTSAGTSIVHDAWGVGSIKGCGNYVYYAGNEWPGDVELWRTDGTTAGTKLVKNLLPTGSSSPDHLTDVNGTLFFAASSGNNSRDLWKSDGTEAGTVLVKSIVPGIDWSNSPAMTNVNGTLYFFANDGTHGLELWKSDGTEAGTVMVKDCNPGSGPSIKTYARVNLAAVGNRLFWNAYDPDHGEELWVSDGTEVGTMMVKDLNPGSGSQDMDQFVAVGDKLFFACNAQGLGKEVWVSDGTDQGTHIVKNIRAGYYDSDPSLIAAFQGLLYFYAYDGVHGTKLWKSDGTEGGTVIVNTTVDFSWFGGNSTRGVVAGGKLYFAAGVASLGNELMVTDGTDAGTILAGDIRAGFDSSYPTGLTVLNGAVFFLADDGVHGQELWKAGSQTPPSPVTITQPVTDLLLPLGAKASFSVVASGFPGPFYQWLRDGKEIAGENGTSYSIPSVTMADAVKYTARMTNPAGVYTSVGQLRVVNTAPSKVAANSATTITMAVQAAGAGLTYQWRKNNTEDVVDGGRFSGAKTSKLSIKSFTAADEGNTYTCRVTFGGLHLDAGPFQPLVRQKPVLALSTATAKPFQVSGKADAAITDLITVVNDDPNHPTSYTIKNLPSGMTYNPVTGKLSGMPNKAGDYTIQVIANNQAGSSAPIDVTLHINALDPNLVGTFNGVFGTIAFTVSAVIQDTGAFTGYIGFGGIRTPFAGRLEVTNGAVSSATLRLSVAEPLDAIRFPMTFNFTLDSAGKLTGQLNNLWFGEWYNVFAFRNPWKTTGASPNPATAYVGTYNAAMQVGEGQLVGDYSIPQGNGSLILTVNAAGAVTFTGRSGDGVAMSGSTTLGPAGQVPVAGTFANFNEIIQGWTKITPVAAPGLNTLDSDGSFTWQRLWAIGRLLPFDESPLTIIGGVWTPTAPGALVLGLKDVPADSYNACLKFSQAGVETSFFGKNGSISQPLRLYASGKADFPLGKSNIQTGNTFALNPTTGVFSGSFTLSDANPLRPSQTIVRGSSYYGLIVPRLGKGTGYFLINDLPRLSGETSINTPALSGVVDFVELK